MPTAVPDQEVWVVRYTVPVYAYVNVNTNKVERVVVSDEEIRLDYDRINHEHFPEVVMDPDEMDIPGPLEQAYRNLNLTEQERDQAWDRAEQIVNIAENSDDGWPAWDHGW